VPHLCAFFRWKAHRINAKPREEKTMTKKKTKPKPLSKWAKGALERINETFPSKEESEHPFVVFTRLAVLAKDCGIDVFKEPAKRP